jgi:hypothetical protein
MKTRNTRLKWKRYQDVILDEDNHSNHYIDYHATLKVDSKTRYYLVIEMHPAAKKGHTILARYVYRNEDESPLFEDSKVHGCTIEWFERELRGLEFNLLVELRGVLNKSLDKVNEVIRQ